MKKIIITGLMMAAVAITGLAQDGKLSFSGVIDTYGTTQFTERVGTPGLLIATPKDASAFGLGGANTVLSYEDEKSGLVSDLSFGPRADDANLAGAINQLYAYYNLSESVTITAGQFNTFLGYEVINPADNFNYTVSYLFNEGPFSHTGVKLDVAASDDLSFMLAVTNGHAISSALPNAAAKLQLGGQIGYKGQYLNLIYGAVSSDTATTSNDNIFIDYTGGFDVSETFYVGINGAYSFSASDEAGYTGAALYLQNAFSDKFSLGLRPEYFESISTAEGAENASVFALTLTANASLTDHLKLITDLRYDNSKDKIIESSARRAALTTLTVAAVYSF